ncbi:jerky protein homolog-like [Octopus sinensis]|uniref:Jerky protein homolog-like n=1 Tax=Octopus sinensis TaxID=2607531 RepID=A0A6P7TZB8_9MOLL|nr:jerky protein homolog-like [Octopus sinensis]
MPKCTRLSFECTRLSFLPPNTSTILHPMDQGIIRSFKNKFNKFKFNEILQKIECGYGIHESYKNLTLKDGVLFTYFGWNEVTEETIKNCFRHAKWIPCEEQIQSSNYTIEKYEETIKQLNILDPMEQSDFLDYTYTEIDEVEESLENDDDVNEKQTRGISEEKTPANEINHEDAFKMLHNIKKYYTQDDTFNINAIQMINQLIEDTMFTKKTTLKDYFSLNS